MEESTQQILALGLVAVVVIAELLRRRRKKKQRLSGLNAKKNGTKQERPLRFYRRR